MGTAAGRAQHRSLEVKAERLGAAVAGGPPASTARARAVTGRGDDRRQEDVTPYGGARRRSPTAARAPGEVDAERAVALEVDEAGRHEQAVGERRRALGRASADRPPRRPSSTRTSAGATPSAATTDAADEEQPVTRRRRPPRGGGVARRR